MSLAIVFPGQGSQSVGMLKSFYDEYELARAAFEQASSVLGYDLWKLVAEGETDDESINALRRRQRLNMMATLLLSQGTPMLLAGDEFGNTQHGNNNGYAQDNETCWLDWSLIDTVPEFLEQVRELIDRDPRAGKIARVYLPRHAERLDTVLDADEVFRLNFTGSHSRGTIFRNGDSYITPEMTAAMDRVADAIPEFYFGRFDVRCDDRVVDGLNIHKAQELLCYLLLYRDRLHCREILTSALWPRNTNGPVSKSKFISLFLS